MKKVMFVSLVSLFVSGGAFALGTTDIGSQGNLEPAQKIVSTEFFDSTADVATTVWLDSKTAKSALKRTVSLTFSVVQSSTAATYIGFGTNAQSAQRVKCIKMTGATTRTIPLALASSTGTTIFSNSSDTNVKVFVEILY